MQQHKQNQPQNYNKKKTIIPFLIGLVIFLVALVFFISGANENCDSSCGAVSPGAVGILISTPIMAYGISLMLMGITHFIVNLTINYYYNIHPVLWSFPLFIPICALTILIIRAILGT